MCQILCLVLEGVVVNKGKALPPWRMPANSGFVLHDGEAPGVLRIQNWNLGRFSARVCTESWENLLPIEIGWWVGAGRGAGNSWRWARAGLKMAKWQDPLRWLPLVLLTAVFTFGVPLTHSTEFQEGRDHLWFLVPGGES